MTPMLVRSLGLATTFSSVATAVAAKRLLSTSIRAVHAQSAAQAKGHGKNGTWSTFAEYREAIIKRDPVTMETRNNIMAQHSRRVNEPEGERVEERSFKDLAKRVAY